MSDLITYLKNLTLVDVTTHLQMTLQSITLFDAILWVSISLASSSILIMCYIIVRRIYIHKREHSDSERLAYLRPMLFKCIDDFGYCDELEAELTARDQELVISIIRQLMDVLRGEVRKKLVAVLRRFGAIKEHVRNLEKGNWGERSLASLDLAWYEPGEVAAALENALDDSSSRVRVSAANSLVTLGVPIDVCNIARKFTVKGSRRPRAMGTFFRRIAPNSVSELTSLLDEDDEGLLIMVIDALGYSNDFSVIDKILKTASHHDSTDVRVAAMRSLTTLGHPACLEAVRNGLLDSAWEVRAHAAIAAGKIGLSDTEASLSGLLSDSHWWVRFRSAEALLALGATGVERLKRATHEGGLAAEIASAVLQEHNEIPHELD